jgi:hypothetical protein
MNKAYLTNDIEDSFLTELDLDEAANICGGGLFGYDPNSLENRHNPANNYPSLSDIVDSAGDNPYLRYAQFMDFGYLD